MLHHFAVGDRVRLIEAYSDLAEGQVGKVLQTYPMPGVYTVQFDGETQSRVVPGPLLTDVSRGARNVQPTMVFQAE